MTMSSYFPTNFNSAKWCFILKEYYTRRFVKTPQEQFYSLTDLARILIYSYILSS